MGEGPIFIVGTPRSGTTLTARILGRHARLFMPGETHYFDDIYSRAKEYGNIQTSDALKKVSDRLFTLYERYYEPEDQNRIERLFKSSTDLLEVFNGSMTYGDIFDRFMSVQMRVCGKNRWGNNAPRDLFSYREIREFFPNSKFIICVRDIRAFLLSYQGKWRVTGEEHVERLRKLYHPVVTSYLWKASMRMVCQLKRDIPRKDWVIVPYERLVTHPDETVRLVCNTIEEEFDPSMLDVDTNNSSDLNEKHGIFPTSIDRWCTHLPPEDIFVGQSVAGRLLDEFGYQRVDVRTSRLRILRILGSTPIALWRALDANKDVRGPLIPYLVRRIGALLGPRS